MPCIPIPAKRTWKSRWVWSWRSCGGNLGLFSAGKHGDHQQHISKRCHNVQCVTGVVQGAWRMSVSIYTIPLDNPFPTIPAAHLLFASSPCSRYSVLCPFRVLSHCWGPATQLSHLEHLETRQQRHGDDEGSSLGLLVPQSVFQQECCSPWQLNSTHCCIFGDSVSPQLRQQKEPVPVGFVTAWVGVQVAIRPLMY